MATKEKKKDTNVMAIVELIIIVCLVFTLGFICYNKGLVSNNTSGKNNAAGVSTKDYCVGEYYFENDNIPNYPSKNTYILNEDGTYEYKNETSGQQGKYFIRDNDIYFIYYPSISGFEASLQVSKHTIAADCSSLTIDNHLGDNITIKYEKK